jgi:putative ABC transport system permease protein
VTAGGEAEPAASVTAGGEGEPAASDAAETDALVWEPTPATADLTVTGLFDDSAPTFSTSRPGAQAPIATFDQLGVLQGDLSTRNPGALLIELEDGAEDSPALRQAIFDSLAAAWQTSDWAAECPAGLVPKLAPGPWAPAVNQLCAMLIMSPRQAAAVRASEYLDDEMIKAVVAVFALVSLMTGALVIANTFQVTIAGRARTLALLRSVGATRRQIHRSVVIEALVTGFGAAVAGVMAGWGLIRVALTVATRLYPEVPLPTAVALSPGAVAGALAVGVVTTVLASLAPARVATRVAPIEALRPRSAPSLALPAGRRRLVWSAALAALGAGGLALGLWLANWRPDVAGMEASSLVAAAVCGVLGGGLMAAGIILGSVFWLPKVVGAIARLIARSAGGARIASANVVRNPRRTAASATALMVGVTLVGSMLVAAAGFNRTIDAYVERRLPVDLQLGYANDRFAPTDDPDWFDEPLINQTVPLELVRQIEEIPGVTDSAPLQATTAQIVDDLGVSVSYVIIGVDPDRLRATLDLPLADQLAENVVLVSEFFDNQLSQMSQYLTAYDADEWIEPTPQPVSGSTRQVVAADGSTVELSFVHSADLDCYSGWCGGLMVDLATLEALGGGQTVAALFAVSPEVDAAAVQDEVQALVTDSSAEYAEAFAVSGGAVDKADARKALATMTLIGVALLAVSMLVALIGISNTLSLSVIERRHETALLRALGLSRAQTRWMLAVEALVVAGVACLMGVVFGVVYGFTACAILLGPTFGAVELVFPAGGVAALVGLVLAAGLLASVLPGRRAARTPPAAALATE